MAAKVKALVWEECRVGGVIAAWTTLFGILCLAVFRLEAGSDVWRGNREVLLLVQLGAPLLVALLLVLNPDNLGNLVGGFSTRVLRLPVPTSVAVAISLLMRTLFVLLAALASFGGAWLIVQSDVGLRTVFMITAVYLLAQLLDWLRGAVSGLSSLLLALGLTALVLLFREGEPLIDAVMASRLVAFAATPLGLVVGAAVVYVISLGAVRAARVGRIGGIPEIWDWPKQFTLPRAGRIKPFRSPLSAQVWHELRRYGWILPITTLLVLVLVALAVWPTMEPGSRRLFIAILPLLALVLASVVHGVRTSLLGIRRRIGRPGFQYLQPLTSAQFALARGLANAIVLAPMVIAVLILHYALGARTYLTGIIPVALSEGVTNYREVIWTLISRGLLVGVAAWALMAIGTRLILGLWYAGLVYAGIIILALVATDSAYDTPTALSLAAVLTAKGYIVVLVLIVATLGSFLSAWRKRIVSGRALVAWGGVWALTAYLFYHAVASGWPSVPVSLGIRATTILSAVGWAALVPMPWAAYLLDVHRRRHSAAPIQDPAQRETALPRGSRIAWGGAVCAIVFALWISWPATPAWVELWRSKGYPVTGSELNAWYPEVPEEENRALKYLEVHDTRSRLVADYHATQDVRYGLGPHSPKAYMDEVLIVGGAEEGVKHDEPIPQNLWDATETYWEAVTSHIAPELEQIGREGGPSRYPVDFSAGIADFDLGHLSRLRASARELSLNALHWAVLGDSERATDSILAMIPLANSLDKEPVLISQLVRIACLGIGRRAYEQGMNRTVLDEQDLARLQRGFAEALPAPGQCMIMDRAMVGESAMILGAIEQTWKGVFWEGLPTAPAPYLTPYRLAFPAQADQLIAAASLQQFATISRAPWPEFRRDQEEWSETILPEGANMMSILIPLTMPALERAYEAEWRTRMELAITETALAVERYRLAEGRLPTGLDELAPGYLETVPEDYFAGKGVPLKYRASPDSSYVVYSVSRDMEDDGGIETKTWRDDGDVAFTVAPLSVRQGNPIGPTGALPTRSWFVVTP